MIFRNTVVLAVAVGAALALAPAAEAKKYKISKQAYVDKEKGFAIHMVEEFEPFPTPPGTRYIVMNFRGKPEDWEWVEHETDCVVIFVPKKAETTTVEVEGADGEEGGTVEIDIEELLGRKVETAWDYLDAVWGKERVHVNDRVQKFKVKQHVEGERRPKKIAATLQTYTIDGQVGMGYQGVGAIISTPEGEWGLFYKVIKRKFDDYYQAFCQSAATFEILGIEAPDTTEDEAAMNEHDPEAFRAAQKRKLRPPWKALDTPHYLIIHHVDDRFARELGMRLETMRALYEQMFPPHKKIEAVSVVRICADRSEYWHYGGPGGSAGYWSKWDKELVFYEDKEGGKGDTRAVLNHEAFHQYIYYFYGEISPHSWYNEGHGDYFSGVDVDRQTNKIKGIKPFIWRTETVREAAAHGNLVPLEQFVRYTQGQYYSDAGLCYAQGWAFIYFLRQSRALKPEWRTILDTYLKVIEEETARREAERKAEEEAEAAEGEEGGGDEAGGDEAGGDEGGDEAGGDEGGEEDGGLDAFARQFDEDKEILDKAVDVAFQGIDFYELEEAFHAFIENNFKDK